MPHLRQAGLGLMMCGVATRSGYPAMSQENVEIVLDSSMSRAGATPQPPRLKRVSAKAEGAERTIVERAGLRWPSIWPRTTQSVLRLPPGSRIRLAMLRRAVQIAFDAWNRGDLELVPYIDDPEVETHITQGSGPPIGFDAVYYGPEGHCRAMEIWNEAWRDWRADIDEIIEDGRDRIVVIARVYAEGSASGVKVQEWAAVRYMFRQGRILRVDAAFFPDRDRALAGLVENGDEALKAAGLSE
jgi:ketosteroid isomerase-like protein